MEGDHLNRIDCETGKFLKKITNPITCLGGRKGASGAEMLEKTGDYMEVPVWKVIKCVEENDEVVELEADNIEFDDYIYTLLRH